MLGVQPQTNEKGSRLAIVAAALRFIGESLGFKVRTDQKFGPGGQRSIELSVPGAGHGLFTPEGHEDRVGSFQPISFWCDDVYQTAEVLKRRGVKFCKESKKEQWGSLAVFEDAEGNPFVLSSG